MDTISSNQQLSPPSVSTECEKKQAPETLDRYLHTLSLYQVTALKKLYLLEPLPWSHKKIAKAIAIPERTWYDWLHVSQFRNALTDVVRDLSIHHLPIATDAMRKGLRKTNYNFLRLFHELRGDLQPEGSHKTAIQVNVFSSGQQAVIREMAGKLADVD